ncbi:winged helix-turn-helix domain-containing protein [Georgenia sp. EYE_87]|uniref:winged helix-turn-helix domain-containing protein n=1 Tax=Georgenia sp. EYE_87 TaxID=2853448 RepID=UPI0020062C88|nr:winged helix-turn-helix domain-containing protein [Georgenia sp. EYE_87]MCK6211557.1 winged helix-turn-helix domain-containing protein [Georgenia sp. EYE_87]
MTGNVVHDAGKVPVGKEVTVREFRRDLLLRTALEILAEANAPVPAGQVLAEVAKRVELTEFERSLNKSGRPRVDTYVRFASGWLRAIGWIEKSDAGWRITDEGRTGLREHAADVYQVTSRRYRAFARSRKTEERWAQPGWQTVQDAVELIAEGSWSSDEDLADLIDVGSAEIREFLATVNVPHHYRVLGEEGTILADFQWHEAGRTDDPREVLAAEGIEFDIAGRASAEQRIPADELRDALGADASTGARAWLVRGSAVSGVNVVPMWLSESFVSLAAAHLRPLEGGSGYDELRTAVEADYSHLSYHQRRAKLTELFAFLSRMKPGDAVVTTSEGRVYRLFRIEGVVGV